MIDSDLFWLNIHLAHRVFHAKNWKNAAGSANRFRISEMVQNRSNFSRHTGYTLHPVLISHWIETRCNFRDILTGASDNGCGCAIIHCLLHCDKLDANDGERIFQLTIADALFLASFYQTTRGHLMRNKKDCLGKKSARNEERPLPLRRIKGKNCHVEQICFKFSTSRWASIGFSIADGTRACRNKFLFLEKHHLHRVIRTSIFAS